jgi:hypothetical protein
MTLVNSAKNDQRFIQLRRLEKGQSPQLRDCEPLADWCSPPGMEVVSR